MANSISHASLPYPIKNARYTLLVPYLDADGDPTDPTTPDTEVSQDGGSFADAAEEVTTITGSNGCGYITLTGAETNNSAVALAFKVASGPKATLATLYPRNLPILESGTAGAGASGTITLASGTYTGLNLAGCFVRTTGGTGGGGTGGANNQARRISSYNTSTRVATITPNWETTPDNTTTYDILLPEGILVPMLTALAPTTLARTLDVSSGGEAGVDWANVGSPTTSLNLSGTTISTSQAVASVSGAVGSVTGAVGSVTAGVNVTQIEGGDATDAIEYRVRNALGFTDNDLNNRVTALQTSADAIEADTQDIQSRLPAALTGDGNIKADSLRVSGSATAADNMEVVFATDFATNYSTTNDQWVVSSSAVASVTGAVGSVTAGVNVTQIEGEDATDTLEYRVRNALGFTDNDLNNRVAAITASIGTMSDLGNGADIGHNLSDLWTQTSVVEGKIDTIDGNVDAILVDTGTSGVIVATNNDKTGYDCNASSIGGSTQSGGVDLTALATGSNGFAAIKTAVGVVGSDVLTNGTVLSLLAGAGFDTSTDSLEAIRNRGDAAWVTATGFSTLDAAGVRSAVGLASANLDTQLGDLPTNSELATSQAAADDATLAAIAALNNLSAAQVRTELATELGRIDVAVSTRLSTAGYTAPDNTGIAAIQAVTDQLADTLEDNSGTYRFTVASLANAPGGAGSSLTAAEVWDLANGIETGFTPRETMRLMSSVLCGEASGMNTTAASFRNMADTKTRVSFTRDVGARTGATYDKT